MKTILIAALALSYTAIAEVAPNDWEALIDKEGFSDWTIEGKSRADFSISGDTISGQPVGKSPKNSFLCSPKQYRDFELRFSFRISDPYLNSGIQFRSEVIDSQLAGPQLEVETQGPENEPLLRRVGKAVYYFLNNRTSQDWASAGIYGENMGHQWIYPGLAGGDNKAFAEQGQRLTRSDDWNEVHLKARGAHIQTWLNGELRSDFRYPSIDKEGLICLQVHGGQYDDPSQYTVEWKKLMIKPL